MAAPRSTINSSKRSILPRNDKINQIKPRTKKIHNNNITSLEDNSTAIDNLTDFPPLLHIIGPSTMNNQPKLDVPSYCEVAATITYKTEFNTWEQFLALPTRPDLSIHANYNQLFCLLNTKIHTVYNKSTSSTIQNANNTTAPLSATKLEKDYKRDQEQQFGNHTFFNASTEPNTTTSANVPLQHTNIETDSTKAQKQSSINYILINDTPEPKNTSKLKSFSKTTTKPKTTETTNKPNDDPTNSYKTTNVPKTKTAPKTTTLPKTTTEFKTTTSSTTTPTTSSTTQQQTSQLKTYTRTPRENSTAPNMLLSAPLLLQENYKYYHFRSTRYEDMDFEYHLKELATEYFEDINENLRITIALWDATAYDSKSKASYSEKEKIRNSTVQDLYRITQNFQQLFMDTFQFYPELITPTMHPVIQTSINIFTHNNILDIFETNVNNIIQSTIPRDCFPCPSRLHALPLHDIPISLHNISTALTSKLHEHLSFCIDTLCTSFDDTFGNFLMTLFFQHLLHINLANDIIIPTFDAFHDNIHHILSHFSYYKFSALSSLDIQPFS